MMAGANNGNSDSNKNWKGSSKETATDQIRYRWQMTSAEQERSKRDRSWQRLLIKAGAIVGVGLLLYVVYLFWVMRLPTRTPMLAVTVSFYPEQFPPNLFAEEDVLGLSRLDGKNISLFRESSFSRFDAGLKQLAKEVPYRGTVMISLNAHGAVNEDGEPCLIPAEASPLDFATWIPLKSVLDKIAGQSFAKTSPVVVFLDCQHQQFEPRMGLLENPFFEKLKIFLGDTGEDPDSEWITNYEGIRLALVVSASSGETSQYRFADQVPVFGHFLQAALAGEADLKKDGSRGDRKVTLEECYQYLEKQVAEWSDRNRGVSQTISLSRTRSFGNPGSVILAYTLDETIPALAVNSESISSDDRQALWDRYHKLDLINLRKIVPEQLAGLEERLLRLDQWSEAGIAYREPVRSLATRLDGDLAKFEQSSTPELFSPLPIKVHSLPLAKGLNHRLSSELAEWEQAFQALNPSRESLTALRDRWQDRVGEFRPAEYHFLDLLLSDAPEALWTQSSLLSEALNAVLEAHRVASVLEARSFQGLSTLITEADEIRRTADDRLFQDDPALWTEAFEKYQSARSKYQSILQQAQRREAGYQRCDEVDAALPYLWEWAVRVPAKRSVGEIPATELPEILAEMAQGSQDLRQRLDSGAQVPLEEEVEDGADKEVLSKLSSLDGLYTQIWNAFDSDAKFFSGVVQQDLEEFADASALLRLPMLSGQTRRVLEDAREAILAKYGRGQEESPSSGKASRAQIPSALAALMEFLKSPENSHQLDRQAGPEHNPNLTRDWEISFRNRLKQSFRSSDGNSSDEPSDWNDDELAQEFFSKYSPLIRQTTAWNSNRSGTPQLILKQQQFLASRELLGEAERTLIDFWGPTSTRSQVFSLTAAQTLLDSSDQLLNQQISNDALRSAVSLHLNNCRTLVAQGLIANTAPEIVFHPQAPTQIELSLTQPKGETVWPAGDWTMFLAREGGKVVSNSALIPGMKPVSELTSDSWKELTLAPPGGIHDDQYRGVYYFRGHRFETPLDLQFVGGPTVTREIEKRSPTQVTVSGSYGGSITYLFVLDCSYSMQKTVDANGTTRLQTAVATLKKALEFLRGNEKIRVGVLFYGHRVTWNQRDPDQLQYQPNWPGEIPPNLLPLEDVELVLSPGPVDDSAMKQFESRIGYLQPWGETPLYLALVKAAALVDPQFGGETHIVAITDGADNQRIPKELILTDAQQTQIKTRDDVIAAAAKLNAKIDLLSFEMDPQESTNSRDAFRDISTQTSGSDYPAVNADKLLDVIRQILGPSEFSVSDRSLRTTDPLPLFGQAVNLDLSNESPQTFGVSVGQTTEQLLLWGGESVRMYFDRKDNRLFVKPYRKELVQSKRLPPAGGAPFPDVSIGFHSPRREPDQDDRVRFRCSISSDSDRYVARPESSVVRVRALAKDGTPLGQVWYAFNPLFAADVSIPVVEFVAENWPQDATHASVELWATWKSTEPQHTAPLDQYLQASEATTDPQIGRILFARRSPEQNGTYFLIEKAAENSTLENPFLMSIVSNGQTAPLNWTVRHRFDSKLGVHLQEMIPEHAHPEPLLDAQVEIRTFEEFTQSSLSAGEPMVLEVLPAGTILEPTGR